MMKKRKVRKIFFLFLVIAITSVVLIVETYAWFVGTSTVSTDVFTINVTGAQGLELSLDGTTWYSDSNKLTISQAAITTDLSSTYSTNTNKWPIGGLYPVSSSGHLDLSVSRLIFYEKASLAATEGGFRLIANRVDNYTSNNDVLVSEAEGYVAFDLFIRNGMGDAYNGSNQESVYLMKDPVATIDGTTDYGAANSLRIGFFELGAVKAKNVNVNTLYAIKCNYTSGGITNKCYAEGQARGAVWNIWEPNNASHTSSAVSYFNQACKKRDSSGNYLSTACTSLTTTLSKVTYAIRSDISSSDNVDIYDGQYLNSYAGTTYSSTNTDGKLTSMATYKSPTSSTTYDTNNQLLTLAGNSITKVRVYIWLEGQDIDNYDVITGNSNVKISFGLTKDRYEIGGSPSPSS